MEMRGYVPLAFREYFSFIRHETKFGPRVVMRDMAGMLRLVWQENQFEDILAFSEENGWRFTLFFTARNLEKHRHWVEQFLEQGHEIASHSYSHRLFPHMGDSELREEFVRAEECFDELGLKPVGLRAPFLASDSRVPGLAKEFSFEYLSTQHGGDSFMYPNGVWEFPVIRPYDWYGLEVMKRGYEEIGRLWENLDGTVTLVHPRYFRGMEPVILNLHQGHWKDKRICSLFKGTRGKEHGREQALSFDIY